jgi:hypothetical protein
MYPPGVAQFLHRLCRPVFLVLAAALLLALPSWAVEPLVAGSMDVDWQRAGIEAYHTNTFQNDFLGRAELFDSALTEWQHSGIEQADRWLELARETFGSYRLEDVHGENAAFVLRGVLLRAECLAFAAVDRMVYGRHEAIDLHEESIRILQEVMIAGERQAGVDRLPDFTRQMVPLMDGRWVPHPRAGFESVGSGFKSGTLGNRRLDQRVSSIRGEGVYLGLDEVRRRIGEDWMQWTEDRRRRFGGRLSPAELSRRATEQFVRSAPRQLASSEAARLLLGQLCPWGVDVYLTMRKSGLVSDDLDFSILDPFASSDPRIARRDLPKKSVLVLEEESVPLPIRREAEAIVGDGKVGSLAPAGPARVEWRYVGEPTYTLWVISPRVFNPTVSERLSQASDVLSVVIGGVPSFLAGKLFAGAADFVSRMSESFTPTHATLVVEAKGVVNIAQNVADQGLSSQLPNIASTLAKWGFAWLDQYEINNRFDGIDPRLLKLGTSYDGSPIPPVLVRADIAGFVVQEDDYPSWVYVNRSYVFRPEGFASRNPENIRNRYERDVTVFSELYETAFGVPAELLPPGLDLSKSDDFALAEERYTLAHEDEYLARDPVVQANSWSRLPGHLGARTLILDTAPQQTIGLPLTSDAQRVVSNLKNLWIQLSYTDGSRTILNEPLTAQYVAPEVRLQVLTRTADTVASRGYVEDIQELVDREGRNARGQLLSLMQYSEVSGDVRSSYRLRIVHNGAVLHERTIVLDPGVGRTRTVTGTLHRIDDSSVRITLDPPLDLLRLEGRWDGLSGGHEEQEEGAL